MLSILYNKELFSDPLPVTSSDPHSAWIVSNFFAAANKSCFNDSFSLCKNFTISWQSWRSCLVCSSSLFSSTKSASFCPPCKLKCSRCFFKTCISLSSSSFSPWSFFMMMSLITSFPSLHFSISEHLCWLLSKSSWSFLLLSRASTTLSFNLRFCSVSSLMRISKFATWRRIKRCKRYLSIVTISFPKVSYVSSTDWSSQLKSADIEPTEMTNAKRRVLNLSDMASRKDSFNWRHICMHV